MVNVKYLLILGFAALVVFCVVIFARLRIFEDKDFDYDSSWSTEAFFNAFPSDIQSVEVFSSDDNDGRERSYTQLKQSPEVLQSSSQTEISAFLSALRNRDAQTVALESPETLSLNMERPDKVFHIVLWKKNHAVSGYGQVLIFNRNGKEIGFVKAFDGTGAYQQNETIVEYLEKAADKKDKHE